MFQAVSMTGSGLAVLAIVQLLNLVGVTVDESQVAQAVEGLVVLVGIVLTVLGQLRRSDLEFGLFRK